MAFPDPHQAPDSAELAQLATEALEEQAPRAGRGWSVPTVVSVALAVFSFIGSLLSAGGGYLVNEYRLGQVEKDLAAHVAESDKAKAEIAQRDEKLNDQILGVKSDHSTRLTILEERTAAIFAALQRIEVKLDHPPSRGR